MNPATAIRVFLEREPEIARRMRAKHGDLAVLRTRRAMAAGDETEVAFAPARFAGTDAPRIALLWLGDRALAAGEAQRALDYYEQAAHTQARDADDSTQSSEIDTRMELARALLGRAAVHEIRGEARIGEQTWPQQEFAELLTSLRQAAAPRVGMVEVYTTQSQAAMPRFNAEYQPKREMQLPLPRGIYPDKVPQIDGDAPIGQMSREFREFSTGMAGDRLWATNSRGMACFDPAAGNMIWQVHFDGGATGRSPLAPVPHRPAFLNNLAIVTVHREHNDSLWALRIDQQGQRAWTFDASAAPNANLGMARIVSDPFVADGRLYALHLVPQSEGHHRLRLVEHDPASGKPLTGHDLILLRDTFRQRSAAQVTATPHGWIALLGGLTLAFDRQGELLWQREETPLPQGEDFAWGRQFHQPPLIVDNRAYLLQPSGMAVECLNVATGQRYWSQPWHGWQRILGVADDCLIVRASEGLAGLDAATGKVRWLHREAALLDGCSLLEGGTLLCARVRPPENAPHERQIELVLLEAATGKPLQSHPLTDLRGPSPQMPQLVWTGKQWVALFASHAGEGHLTWVRFP